MPSTGGTQPAAGEPPPVIVLGIGAVDAREVLIRQFVAQEGTGGGAETPVHRAVLDTTQAVWDLPGLSPADSAFAAYVRGLSFRALGNRAAAIDWLDRAVRIEPDGEVRGRYELARDAVRGTPR